MMRPTSLVALFVLCFGVAGYGLVAYGFMPVGAGVHPDMRATFEAHSVGIKVHVFAAALALLLGPFQFLSRLRSSHPELHRLMGRIYLGVAVLIGGVAGLYMSFFAFGGLVAKLGFGCLAAAWLYTGARAYLSVRGGEILTHRRWMIRNFALTFAAVTLRLYLPPTFIFRIPFEQAYPVIAWACWVPNLLVAEWIIKAMRTSQPRPAAIGRPAG
jgi:uncharacterized membrane protein